MEQKNSHKRITCKDVAQKAGVSVGTVSSVINNRTQEKIRISPETQKRVWQVIKDLGYQPLNSARSLRTRRTNLLALMIPSIANPFQSQFADSIQREAEKYKMDVMILSTHDDLLREKKLLNMLLSRMVDGVILQSYQLTDVDLDPLIKNGLSIVIHGNSPTHPYVDNVMIDEVLAAEKIVTHLIEKGHRRIGIITTPDRTWTGSLRKQGYLNSLASHNIPLCSELIVEVDINKPKAGAKAMEYFLSLPDRPTAVFATGDLFAFDALVYTIDAGLSVPQDMAFVGFDDTAGASLVRPKLTTVRKDANLLGGSCVQLLMNRIQSSYLLPAHKLMCSHEIILRESA